MYVEDEPDIRAVAQLALELVGGYEVMVCASGQQALVQCVPFAPDFILLDVMMPEMDGPSTLHELRKIPSIKTVPAAFMTAKAQVTEISELLAFGACGVIPKPFDPMTLAEQVKEIWAQRSGA
jgi:two-component system, OmpR family, response regulator